MQKDYKYYYWAFFEHDMIIFSLAHELLLSSSSLFLSSTSYDSRIYSSPYINFSSLFATASWVRVMLAR